MKKRRTCGIVGDLDSGDATEGGLCSELKKSYLEDWKNKRLGVPRSSNTHDPGWCQEEEGRSNAHK